MGKRDNIYNYRLISTLTIESKIFEKVMNKRWYSFLTNIKFNIRKSLVFKRINLYTNNAALLLTNYAYSAFNSKDNLLAVLFNFWKAFDTVDHWILIPKLETLGIRDFALLWL